jgi:succinate dehydrogenase / fumarate reductase flavoprotein subunit
MKTDVLIIGAGGAGLSAAIVAKEAGVDVMVLTKEYPTRSQTCMAQGGINAALGNVEIDSIEAHIQDTLKSAQGLANEEAVRFMCSQAPAAIDWLDSIGVPFSRTADAKIAQRRLGGASAARACYAQDYTGLKILHTLYDKALALGIEMKNEKYLVDLLKSSDGSVCGVKMLDIRTGEIEHYFAKSVIIASGGYSRIYGTFSTNSKKSTGDGIAAAKRAGATLIDMEFVQFHPTGLKKSSILVSEAARGEGGFIIDDDGERFVDELLPRDQLARAIDAKIKEGKNVFIDIRHLGEQKIEELLPQERKLAKLYEGVDPLFEPIPIKPVAHYTMGGIAVNNRSQTSLMGLFACGECANHRVHGANRLGGNSLLEIIVFGKEAGVNAATYAKETTLQSATMQENGVILEGSCEIDFYEQQKHLAKLFYLQVGIVRKKSELLALQEELARIVTLLPKMGVKDKLKEYNTNRIEFLEFVNMLEVAQSVVSAALSRKESCGAHYIAEE